MKFIKRVIIGTAISAGAWMLYSESKKKEKNNFIKQGKIFLKSIGMM